MITSIQHALWGLAQALKRERNMKIHCLAILICLANSFWLQISSTEWIITVLCMAIVVALEMINTAIEKLCDFIEPRRDPDIKFIKDVSAGAVFTASIGALIIGGIIFIPKILSL